jgi:hypothetical protein
VITDALPPIVGSSASVQIVSVITSLTADGITPTISTSRSIWIESIVGESTIDAFIPTIQTDVIVYSITTEIQATGISPYLNAPIYKQTIEYVMKINTLLNYDLNITTSKELKVGIAPVKEFTFKI